MSAQHLRAAALFGVVMLVVSGCATLPEGFDKPESFAYTDTDGTALGKAVQARRAGRAGRCGVESGPDSTAPRCEP